MQACQRKGSYSKSVFLFDHDYVTVVLLQNHELFWDFSTEENIFCNAVDKTKGKNEELNW